MAPAKPNIAAKGQLPSWLRMLNSVYFASTTVPLSASASGAAVSWKEGRGIDQTRLRTASA